MPSREQASDIVPELIIAAFAVMGRRRWGPAAPAPLSAGRRESSPSRIFFMRGVGYTAAARSPASLSIAPHMTGNILDTAISLLPESMRISPSAPYLTGGS